MAVSKTTITGPVYLPNCEKPEEARIVFELTSWDRQENEAVFVTGPYVAELDVNGDFSTELFTTTDGVNGVIYRVSVVYITISGEHKREYLGFFTLLGPGPFCLADLEIESEYLANTFDALTEIAAHVAELRLARGSVYSEAAAASALLAQSAADVTGVSSVFATKASADAATLTNGQIVEVSKDETLGNLRVRYEVVSGVLVNPVSMPNGAKQYANVYDASLGAATLPLGTLITVEGYYDSGDGGGQDIVVIDDVTPNGNDIPLPNYARLGLSRRNFELKNFGLVMGEGLSVTQRNENSNRMDDIFLNKLWNSETVNVIDNNKQILETTGITAESNVDLGSGSIVGSMCAPGTKIQSYGTNRHPLLIKPNVPDPLTPETAKAKFVRSPKIILASIEGMSTSGMHTIYMGKGDSTGTNDGTGGSLYDFQFNFGTVSTNNPLSHVWRIESEHEFPNLTTTGVWRFSIVRGYFRIGVCEVAGATTSVEAGYMKSDRTGYTDLTIDIGDWRMKESPINFMTMYNTHPDTSPTGITIAPSTVELARAGLVLDGVSQVNIGEMKIWDTHGTAVGPMLDIRGTHRSCRDIGISSYLRNVDMDMNSHPDISIDGLAQNIILNRIRAPGLTGLVDVISGTGRLNDSASVSLTDTSDTRFRRSDEDVVSSDTIHFDNFSTDKGRTYTIVSGELTFGGSAETAFIDWIVSVNTSGTITSLPAPTHDGQRVTILPHSSAITFDIDLSTLVGAETGVSNPVTDPYGITLIGWTRGWVIESQPPTVDT